MSKVLNAEEKYKMMTESKIEPLICKMAIPTIISMLSTSFYNMADTYFVGTLGKSATAAVGVIFPLMALIQALGFFFGHGTGNFISRRLGEKNMKEAEEMAATGFISSLLGGVLVAAAGLIFLKPLVDLLGATETIRPHAEDYLWYILLGAPFMTASFTLNNQLRFQGNAFYAMFGVVAGGVLNIALDPLFIFIFHMGTGGAALATSISQAVGFGLLFYGTTKRGIPIRLKNVKLRFYYYREMFRGGAPSLFRQGCGSIATVLLNRMAGLYGSGIDARDAAIAAMSVVTRITMFASSAMIGFGQGFQPVCGFNYGARKYERVKKAFWFCIKSSFLILLGIGAIGVVFAPQILSLFSNEPDVIEIGALALRMHAITFPLTGFIVLCNMMAQTIGKTVKATVLALSRQFIFFVPALLVASYFLKLFGVQISQPIADVLSLLISVPIARSILKEMKTSN